MYNLVTQNSSQSLDLLFINRNENKEKIVF
jgi:hypothetical protein